MRYLIIILIFSVNIYSQEIVEKDSLWTKRGNVTVLLNQTGFSDWVGGGTNNFSATIKFDYEWEYKDKGWDWLSNVESAFGIAKYKNAPFARKIDDRILIQSIVGKEFTRNLSFSAFFNFTSQIGNGYKYKKDSENNEIRELTTRIFSPAYFQIGSGFLWKKDEKIWVNYSPIASRLILVSKKFTDDLLENETYFGVSQNKSSRYELGANLTFHSEGKLLENVNYKQDLKLFSNYIEEASNIDLDYLAQIEINVNPLLTTQLIFQLIYDDNAVSRLQVREVFGVGVQLKLN
ncbi:DUF3078 domain-containing protein [Flavobacteriaceae bacterium]|nr:DUF3078 domain-containing protein [Flavobacteriaceae bacterium]MDA8704002.1 DUF3078 domain-containing protein [Flavobacteriaceae bacterium]MDA9084524.1 DUF3078 domain-containing protein [Flavobacteriaceae bacterium]MDB3874433.1 DUF3078 domain-containing protein [Flavobacteriaceae bacterium]MDC0479472.1 DUF3078 domain-containing protein [Flavobacteriaceae bacterium]|tara:strand:+ start:2363 stop:3235 length:873 start_codon:yes stop_codon:yes gene_type:complete